MLERWRRQHGKVERLAERSAGHWRRSIATRASIGSRIAGWHRAPLVGGAFVAGLLTGLARDDDRDRPSTRRRALRLANTVVVAWRFLAPAGTPGPAP